MNKEKEKQRNIKASESQPRDGDERGVKRVCEGYSRRGDPVRSEEHNGERAHTHAHRTQMKTHTCINNQRVMSAFPDRWDQHKLSLVRTSVCMCVCVHCSKGMKTVKEMTGEERAHTNICRDSRLEGRYHACRVIRL